MNWWVYVIRCGDGTFYTGMALDVNRRLTRHQQGHGARYTRGRGPLELWWSTGPLTRQEAMSLEIRVKGYSHAQKELLRGH